MLQNQEFLTVSSFFFSACVPNTVLNRIYNSQSAEIDKCIYEVLWRIYAIWNSWMQTGLMKLSSCQQFAGECHAAYRGVNVLLNIFSKMHVLNLFSISFYLNDN